MWDQGHGSCAEAQKESPQRDMTSWAGERNIPPLLACMHVAYRCLTQVKIIVVGPKTVPQGFFLFLAPLTPLSWMPPFGANIAPQFFSPLPCGRSTPSARGSGV